jgi:mono/diheme cytochrome c family protein
MTRIGVALAAAAILATPALAADIPTGQRLAQMWCMGCHVVDSSRRRTDSDAVPSFASIAQRPSTTQRSLTVFLSASHGRRMPNYSLSRDEIRDVTAYILSLRK